MPFEYTVQNDQGQTFAVTVDDASHERLQAMSVEDRQNALTQSLAGGQPAPEAPGRRAQPNTAADILRQFGEGFNQVLGTIAQAPTQLGVGLFNQLGITDITPEEAIAADPLTGPAVEFLSRNTPAATPAGRVAETAGRMVAQDVPFAALSLGTAPIGSAVARRAADFALREGTGLIPRAANVVRGGVGQLQQGVAAAPARAAAGELVAATGAGTATGIAREAGAPPGVQQAAGLAGGAVGPVAANLPGRAVARGVSAVRSRISGPQAEAAAEEATGETLREALRTADPEFVRESARVARDVPGLELSLAERTGAPRLLQAQTRMGDTLEGQAFVDELARRSGNQQAVANAAQNLIDGDIAPERVVEAARTATRSRLDDLDVQATRATAEEREVAGRIRPARTRQDIGAEIRENVRTQRRETKRNLRNTATAMGLNDPEARINISVLRARLVDAYTRASRLRLQSEDDVARALRDVPVMRTIRDLDSRQSVDGITELRSLVGEEMEIAYREARPGNASVRRGLAAVQRVLDDFMDNIDQAVPDPGLGQRMRDFRDLYRRTYIQPFEQGAAFRTLRRTGQRDYRLRDEQVAAEFFKPDDAQAAQQYRQIFTRRSAEAPIPVQRVEAPTPAERVHQVAADAADLNERVRLSEIRDALPDMSRQEVDEALLQLQRENRLTLFGLDNPREILPRDREAALDLGPGGVRHVLRVSEAPASRPTAEEGLDPAALRNIEDAALDSLADNAVVDGVIDPARFRTWRRRHAVPLDAFPEVRQRIDNIDNARVALAARQEELRNRRAVAESSILARELRAVEGGVRTPEEFLDRMLTNPARSRALVEGLETDEARAGLARTAWDRVQRQPNPLEFLNANTRALIDAFGGGRQGMDRLMRARNILIAGQRAGQVPPPQGVDIASNPSVANLENFLNTGLNQISSRVFAVASGRTSTRFIGTELAGRFLRGFSQRRADEILQEALFDPELARRLSEGITRPQDEQTARRLYTYLASVGLGPDEEGQTQ